MDKIKLVVWDLDDTFWKGTLSEAEVMPTPENLKLIKELTASIIKKLLASFLNLSLA